LKGNEKNEDSDVLEKASFKGFAPMMVVICEVLPSEVRDSTKQYDR